MNYVSKMNFAHVLTYLYMFKLKNIQYGCTTNTIQNNYIKYKNKIVEFKIAHMCSQVFFPY